MKKLIFAILVIAVSSCSSGELNKLSINCLCSVSEHFKTSTNEEDKHIKEFSFTNSKVIAYGVDEEHFALSSAILIKNDFEIDSASAIKISLVTKEGIKKNTKYYIYEQDDLENLSAKYFEIESLINDFVRNIYETDFSACKSLTSIEIEEEEFNSVLSKIQTEMDEGYIDTRIIGYAIGEEYFVYGGVWTETNMLHLFKMNFKDTDEGVKITGFRF